MERRLTNTVLTTHAQAQTHTHICTRAHTHKHKHTQICTRALSNSHILSHFRQDFLFPPPQHFLLYRKIIFTNTPKHTHTSASTVHIFYPYSFQHALILTCIKCFNVFLSFSLFLFLRHTFKSSELHISDIKTFITKVFVSYPL